MRTYADYLGLDAARAVERFKAQIAGRADEQQPTITVIDEDEHRRLPQGWKIVAGVVLLLFAYGAYHLLVPAADKMLAPPVAPAPQAVQPKPHPKKVAIVAPPPVVTAPPAATTPAPGATADTAAVPPEAAPPIPQGKVYGTLNRNARVVLRMKETTRVLVQGPDGTTFINRTLNAGDSYMVPDMVGLTLTAANAGAVEVDLDGAPMGNAGRAGQIAETLSLDPQAIADRANNRR